MRMVLLVVGPTAQGGLEGKRDGLEDLDFYMGNDALKHSTTHQISYPIRHGLIEVCIHHMRSEAPIFQLTIVRDRWRCDMPFW